MDSIYVTFDQITQGTGAGEVCLHEKEALSRATSLATVVSRDDIAPYVDQHYGFNPFLYDYFAAQLVPSGIDIAHLSCSPGVAILEKAKPKKALVNVVAHDLAVSIEEHKRIFRGGYPFPHNTDPLLHKALLRHAERAEAVLTPSTVSEDWIQRNIRPKRIVVIPHGCCIPNDVPDYPDEFKAGYLGVFGPDKGLIYLVMAWDHLCMEDSEFLYAGNCCETLSTLIPSVIRNKSRFRLLGRVDNPGDLYSQISVYVQPSVTEGFGIPVLEAMSHGRPVIVTEGVGAKDIVVDGEQGFVVPIRDPGAIAEKLQYFKDNPDEVRRMGRNARRASMGYSWDRVEERYGDLYESL